MSRELFRESTGTLAVLVDLPSDAKEQALAPPDVSKLPGARVVATSGFELGEVRVSAACVRAPSDRFVVGLESVLFERATALALRTGSLLPTELVATESSSEAGGGFFSQRLEGHTNDRALGMAHLLTFIGSDRDALLCTALCSEPLATKTSCNAIVTSLHLEGSHAPPPEPSLLARTLFLAAEHPRPSLAAFAALTLLLIVIVLWRRPKLPA